MSRSRTVERRAGSLEREFYGPDGDLEKALEVWESQFRVASLPPLLSPGEANSGGIHSKTGTNPLALLFNDEQQNLHGDDRYLHTQRDDIEPNRSGKKWRRYLVDLPPDAIDPRTGKKRGLPDWF